MERILIVDDDAAIGGLLEEALTREGYRVLRAYSGTEALLVLSRHRPDLVLLDLMLPGLSGEELLPKVHDIPVIVVSAKAAIGDKVGLLLAGAVDYITKPFDLDELLARVQVALRTNHTKAADLLTFREISLEPETHSACVSGTIVRLTRTEYAILRLLMQNPSQVVAKSVLLDKLSDDTPDCVENSLKVHISNLRRKLRGVDGTDYIESVWGIGFKMRE